MLWCQNCTTLCTVRWGLTELNRTIPFPSWQCWTLGYSWSFGLPWVIIYSDWTCLELLDPFLWGCFPAFHLPFCTYIPELSHSRCRIQNLILNFMKLVISQPSNLLRPLWKASSPSRESTALPSLVSSENSTPSCHESK